MSKKKQMSLFILGFFITIAMVVGVSYAVWQVTLEQSGSNIITSDCFKIEFSDLNPIHLDKAFPITNEEGDALTPYEFTITNTCNTRANYQINLEILNDTSFTRLEYIREKLNEKGVFSGSRILTRNSTVEKTLENAKEAYKLNQGVLEASESKSYELRLWMDESTPAIEEVMNKTLNTKVTVVTSLKLPVDTTNMMVAMDLEKKCPVNSKLCYLSNSTYTQGEKYEATLKKVIFESVKNPIEGALEVKDFSVNQDESVLGYYVSNEDNTEVTLHIQADGKIKVNENGSYYFSTINDTPPYTFEGFENLDTSEVTNMSLMFSGMSSITSLDLSSFDTSNVTDMSGMFNELSSVTSLDISHFDTRNVTNMSGMFSGMSSLVSLNLSHFDLANVTDMSFMFTEMRSLTGLDVSHFDTSNVTNMSYMFAYASELANLDVSNFDTSNVTNMSNMFANLENLSNLNVSSFSTSKATDMSEMFFGMSSLLSLDVSHFDTRNVTNMNLMFSGMSSLTSLDISSFDTSNVTNMRCMFYNMRSLTSLDVSGFDTRNVMDMAGMFQNMNRLTNLDVSHFDTRNVTDMAGMFQNMNRLTNLDVSDFDTSKVADMSYMFSDSNNLTTIKYGDKFIRKTGSNIVNMFDNCPANKPIHSSWEGAF